MIFSTGARQKEETALCVENVQTGAEKYANYMKKVFEIYTLIGLSKKKYS